MGRWAARLGLIDAPNGRKLHSHETSIGGLAVVAGSLAGFLPFVSPPFVMWSWLAGALSVALLGSLDDRRELSAPVKLVGQTLAALLLVLGGFMMYSITLLDLEIELGALAVPFTVLWLVGITNAFNLMDGLDGLAGGAAVILAAAGAILSIPTGNSQILALSLAVLGAALAFTLFNTHPARLFLGDGGSYFLGFTFAFLTLAAVAGPGGILEEVPLLVPIVLLGYPIADTLWAIMRRIWAGRSIFLPDQEHLHHRWLKRVGDHRRAVWALYGLLVVLAALGLLLRFVWG